MKLTVCIPSYNEAETLPRVLEAVARQAPLVAEIIVINDGSTDRTRDVLEGLQSNWPHPDVLLRAIHFETNRGKGAAVQAAYAEARGTHILIQDADLELTPDDYPAMVQPISEGRAQAVFGDRFPEGFPKDLHPLSKIANWIVTTLSNLLYDLRLRDQACGYKLLPAALARELKLRCDGFEVCSEIAAKLGRRKASIANVPVRYTPRTVAQGKKIRWKDGFTAVGTLLRFRL